MVTETEVLKSLRREIGKDLIDCTLQRERRVYVKVKLAAVRKTVKVLSKKYRARFITLSALDTGLDIELLYHLSLGGIVVTVRASIPKETNETDTITDLMPAARWVEREVAELFGVKFLTHPKPEGLILPDGWPPEKRPLRKPLEGALPIETRSVAESLLSTSCTAPISARIQRKREEAGLPPCPPCASGKMLRELQKLMKQIGFDERAGYDWKKKKLRYE